MKKISFLLMASVVLISCGESKKEAPKNTDLPSDNLLGKVEKATETTYKADSAGKPGDQDSCCVVTTKYDEKGYASGYTSVNKAGTNTEEGVFSHNDNGSFIAQKTTKNGKPFSSVTVQNENGKISGAQEFDSTNKLSFYYTDVTVNDYERLTGFKQYKPDSTLKMSMTNTYDKQILKAQSIKDSVGKETYSSNLKLNDKNNVIESTTKEVTKDSTINKTTKYRYDSFDDTGNWTQKTEMDGNGKPVKIVKRTVTYYKE
ncbi:MAG: hypothetical protein ABI834_08755 [Ginsengibacter sp.]